VRAHRERRRKPKADVPPPEPVTILEQPHLVYEGGQLLLRWW
jgi:hypothetical protein